MQNPPDHIFGQDQVQPGEHRTFVVVLLTAVMMVIEIAVGLSSGSMALLADGLHMASHASALMVSVFAYRYARRHARDPRFNFGTGKVNALAGFAGAVLLVGFALVMVTESTRRIFSPIHIDFGYAIGVAIVGLVVNAVSAVILGGHHAQKHSKAMAHDHNLRSAYLHVIADALTSLLAIGALLAARYKGWVLLDPLMGLVGAFLVTRWSIGLIKQTSAILLDMRAPQPLSDQIRRVIEEDEQSSLSDAHVWCIGPGIYAASLIIETSTGRRAADFRKALPADSGIVHFTIEVTQQKPAAENAD